MRDETIDALEEAIRNLEDSITDNTLDDVQKSLIKKAINNLEDVFND